MLQTFRIVIVPQDSFVAVGKTFWVAEGPRKMIYKISTIRTVICGWGYNDL
jgi:hypothetical protein